jgi:hypothetical protein
MRTDRQTDMTILILYVTGVVQHSIYQTNFTHTEVWTRQIHSLLHVVETSSRLCVCCVHVWGVGLINRDMTRLIIAFMILREVSYRGKKIVLCRIYQIQTACFRPVPVISCGYCCAAVMSFDWERTFQSMELSGNNWMSVVGTCSDKYAAGVVMLQSLHVLISTAVHC